MVSEYTYDVQSWGKVKKGHTQFADGDVAFAKISPCFENRKSMMLYNLPNGIGGGTTELIVLRQPLMCQAYTFWFVSQESFIRGSSATYSGTVGQQRISMNYVKNHPVPLPPLSEQQRIVDRIERLFAKLDEATEKAQSVVDGFESRKAAILSKAFAGELTSHWRDSHTAIPNTMLEDIRRFSTKWPQKDQKLLDNQQQNSDAMIMSNGHVWIKCTIGAVGRVTNGSTPSRKVPEFWNGPIPWISSGEVQNNIINSTNEYITQGGFNNSSVKILPIGTVLIAMIGEGKTRWQSSVLNIEATINQNIAAIIIDHGLINPYFIWYWFQLNYTRNREKGAGSGPQALNCQRVRELDFFVPSLNEQNAIIDILNSLMMKEYQVKEAAEEVLNKIETMKKSILARAFRGQLGTNDPAEESAIELLKQVLRQTPTRS